MNPNSKQAVLSLVVWWVITEIALTFSLSQIPGMDWAFFQPIHGMVMGLVVGFTLKKFCGIKVVHVLWIALGWAGGQMAASYAMYYLFSGINTIRGFLSFEFSNLIRQVIWNSSINTFISGFILGGILGFILSLVLRRASLLGKGIFLVVSLGWAIGSGFGNMLGNFLLYSILHTNSLIVYLLTNAFCDVILSFMAGLLMFKNIQETGSGILSSPQRASY